MRLPLLLLGCALGLASSATAQDLPQSVNDCWKKAQTQADMNVCAGVGASKVEAQLNEKYTKALTLARASGIKGAVTSIEAAQSAWVRYTDAYLEAMYPGEPKQLLWGTIYVSSIGVFRIKLALRQIAAMDDLIAQYTPK
jgi:uncharacterized protein YecT (DUF1311 family)